MGVRVGGGGVYVQRKNYTVMKPCAPALKPNTSISASKDVGERAYSNLVVLLKVRLFGPFPSKILSNIKRLRYSWAAAQISSGHQSRGGLLLNRLRSPHITI